MDWEVVKITASKKGRNTPYATIGYGRISLSKAACNLIENFQQYNYAQLLKGKRNNKLCIGIKFFKESAPDTIKINRKVVNGKQLNSASIENKMIVEELFGIAGTDRKSTKYNVEKDAENILMIYGE